jgi:hypothetical protein
MQVEFGLTASSANRETPTGADFDNTVTKHGNGYATSIKFFIM